MRIEVSMELVLEVGGSPIHECKKISWGQFSDNCINGYAKATKNNPENINLPHDAIVCNNVNYTDDAHISAINVLHDDLIELMSNANDELVSQQGDRRDHINVDLAGMAMPQISTLLLENVL